MKTWAMLCAVAFVAQAQAPYDRILRAESEPGSWLTYSGTYGGHRFSALDQIEEAAAASSGEVLSEADLARIEDLYLSDFKGEKTHAQ